MRPELVREHDDDVRAHETGVETQVVGHDAQRGHEPPAQRRDRVGEPAPLPAPGSPARRRPAADAVRRSRPANAPSTASGASPSAPDATPCATAPSARFEVLGHRRVHAPSLERRTRPVQPEQRHVGRDRRDEVGAAQRVARRAREAGRDGGLVVTDPLPAPASARSAPSPASWLVLPPVARTTLPGDPSGPRAASDASASRCPTAADDRAGTSGPAPAASASFAPVAGTWDAST